MISLKSKRTMHHLKSHIVFFFSNIIALKTLPMQDLTKRIKTIIIRNNNKISCEFTKWAYNNYNHLVECTFQWKFFSLYGVCICTRIYSSCIFFSLYGCDANASAIIIYIFFPLVIFYYVHILLCWCLFCSVVINVINGKYNNK